MSAEAWHTIYAIARRKVHLSQAQNKFTGWLHITISYKKTNIHTMTANNIYTITKVELVEITENNRQMSVTKNLSYECLPY